MDKKIFSIIFNWTKNKPLILKQVKNINKYSKVFYCIIYFSVACCLFINKNSALVFFLGAPASALVFNYLLRNLIKRPRPEIPGKKKSSYSFPSNHSLSSGVISMSTYFICPPLGAILLILSLITALSRIMEGYHYPSDAAAGLLLGYGFSCLGISLYGWFF